MAIQKHRDWFLEGNNQNSSSAKKMGSRDKKYSTETTAQQLGEAVDSKVKINTKETFFFCILLPPKIPIEDLRNIHP